MNSNTHRLFHRASRVRWVAVAAALLIGFAAPAAMAQQAGASADNLRLGDRPADNGPALDARIANQNDLQRRSADSALPPAPNRSTERGMAGAEVGASDDYGYNDSALNARVKRARKPLRILK